MNRLYCIAYLGKVECKWCNTVKHNNNLTGAITSVLLPASFHNDFLGGKKTNFLRHRDFISLLPLSEHKQLFSCMAKVRVHEQYTHKQTRAHQLIDTYMHTYTCKKSLLIFLNWRDVWNYYSWLRSQILCFWVRTFFGYQVFWF